MHGKGLEQCLTPREHSINVGDCHHYDRNFQFSPHCRRIDHDSSTVFVTTWHHEFLIIDSEAICLLVFSRDLLSFRRHCNRLETNQAPLLAYSSSHKQRYPWGLRKPILAQIWCSCSVLTVRLYPAEACLRAFRGSVEVARMSTSYSVVDLGSKWDMRWGKKVFTVASRPQWAAMVITVA